MDIEVTDGQVNHTQRQKRGIWLTVVACVVFITILWMLFYHKITTPRYLSPIELRVNGLVLLKQPQLLFTDLQGQAVAEQLSPRKWRLLVVHEGRCSAACVEYMTSLVIMLGQLQQVHLEKTQLVLVTDSTDSTAELLALINAADQNNVIDPKQIQTISPEDSRWQSVKDSVDRSTQHTASAWPKIIIVDDSGHHRGYFIPPFNHNKMLLTYSSVIAHR